MRGVVLNCRLLKLEGSKFFVHSGTCLYCRRTRRSFSSPAAPGSYPLFFYRCYVITSRYSLLLSSVNLIPDTGRLAIFSRVVRVASRRSLAQSSLALDSAVNELLL